MPRIERVGANYIEPDPLAYEDAKRCPKCKNPGLISGTTSVQGQRGQRAKVETFKCVTESCRWYQTGWAVQINPDGTIPTRSANDPKKFTAMSDHERTIAARYLEQINAEIEVEEDPRPPK